MSTAGIVVPQIVCNAIDRTLAENELTDLVIIAVDGVCGGGKSTLGEALFAKYECNLFHMDDFFLRPEQRTRERYEEPGGNVDYERFQAEVLSHLADEDGVFYRPFCCRTMGFGEMVHIPRRRLNIIEGAYCCHPYFGDIYHARFFVEASPEVQKERLLARNGREQYQRFVREWIPMENRYFDTFEIRRQCILITL